MENYGIAPCAIILFGTTCRTSSQRGQNPRKDSDIFHYPFSIFNSLYLLVWLSIYSKHLPDERLYS